MKYSYIWTLLNTDVTSLDRIKLYYKLNKESTFYDWAHIYLVYTKCPYTLYVCIYK